MTMVAKCTHLVFYCVVHLEQQVVRVLTEHKARKVCIQQQADPVYALRAHTHNTKHQYITTQTAHRFHHRYATWNNLYIQITEN